MARKPRRIQLRRTKGWRLPEGTINVARPSRWGNPIVVGSECMADHIYGIDGLIYPAVPIVITPQIAVDCYREHLEQCLIEPEEDALQEDRDDWQKLVDALEALRGHDLACWCPLTDERGRRVPCHADVLLAISNR